MDKGRTPNETVHNNSDSPSLSAAPDISRMTQSDILALQRQIGNQAVMRLLKQQSSTKESAQRLPDQLGGALGKAFGTDLSGVHIHTDDSANQIARSANADATSMGQDIYFRDGAFNPGTAQGNALIAREIAHIEQGRSRGDSTYVSSDASAAERRDANNVSGMVEAMGANPSEVLQPVRQQPTRLQMQVLQREPGDGDDMEGKYSHMRSFGIASSKIVQGVFTTILGPLSLVWRWPLIQKNMGEALGDDIGTYKGKADDKLRYGTGKLAEAMRFFAIFTELLKEVLIWCGFASLIAAVVAGATHGALTPVFVGIAVATAIIGGVLAALKFTMAGFNAYRWWKNRQMPGEEGKKKRAHIKAQMVNDLMDGFSALLTTVFAALGAGGVTATAGGALAKDMGYTDGAAKGVGAGLNMATQGMGTTVFNNTVKESFKEASKPGKEHGFLGGEKGTLKDGKTKESGGFFKDKLVIDAAYEPIVGAVSSWNPFRSKKKKAAVDTPVADVSGSPDSQQAMGEIAFVVSNVNRIGSEQSAENRDNDKKSGVIGVESGPALNIVNDVSDIKGGLQDSKDKIGEADKQVDTLVVYKDEGEADVQEKKVDEALVKIGKAPIGGKQPNAAVRFGSWLGQKVFGISRGVHELNAWVMKGVIQQVAKMDKSGANPNAVKEAIEEEKSNVLMIMSVEQVNTRSIEEMKEQAAMSQDGISQLAAKEREGQ